MKYNIKIYIIFYLLFFSGCSFNLLNDINIPVEHRTKISGKLYIKFMWIRVNRYNRIVRESENLIKKWFEKSESFRIVSDSSQADYIITIRTNYFYAKAKPNSFIKHLVLGECTIGPITLAGLLGSYAQASSGNGTISSDLQPYLWTMLGISLVCSGLTAWLDIYTVKGLWNFDIKIVSKREATVLIEKHIKIKLSHSGIRFFPDTHKYKMYQTLLNKGVETIDSILVY